MNFKVFMHVGDYYHAVQMYEKSLILGLLILISGNVINFTFQFNDSYFIFAQNEEVNQVPEAEDQKVSVDANDNVKITLKGNDDDDEDDEIEFEIVSDPSHGELDNFDKVDGAVTYTPEEEYSGDDKFEFRVIDDKGAESDKAEIKINVESLGETNQEVGGETNQESHDQTASKASKSNEITSTNQSPIADDQELSTDANTDIDITLIGEDTDNDPIQFEIVSNPADATLNNFDNVKGTVTYSPEVNYTGNDSFSFKVIDDNGVESNVATVSVDVKGATENILTKESAVMANESSVVANESSNNAPKAFDQNISVSANNQLNITLTGEDTDNDPIQFEIVSNPADATLNNFDNVKGTVTYSPEVNYTGNDSFSFKVIDDNGVESNTAIVSVEVTENNQTNQAPHAFDQVTNEANLSDYRYAVWSAGEEEDRYIFFSRSTDGGNTFSSPLSISGKSRTPVFNPEVSSSGNNIYVVWQGQSENGNQDIFMRKSADYGSSFSGVENLSNDPGGSGNPQITINGNTTHVAWEGTTPGNNYIFYSKSDDGSKFDSPQKIGDNKGIPYSPELIVSDNPVTDSFTYKAVDDNGAESNVATVEVNTDGVNQNTLKEETKSISVDSSQEIDITLKAKDPDKDPVQFEIVTPPTEGHIDKFDPSSGKVTYVPDEDNKIDIQWHNYQNGQDRIVSQVVDNGQEVNEKGNSVQTPHHDPFKAKQ
ncbi:MAG: Ig-like domain-containing protein [Nitrososphaerota archaeon]